MEKEAKRLEKLINQMVPLLKAISEGAAMQSPKPGKWSAKQVIGHLVDSAFNNQQKVVRMTAKQHLSFPGYDQDQWVTTQAYQHKSWDSIIELWRINNLHFVHIVRNTPKDSLQNTIEIDGSGPFTLEFIIKDYTEHLIHHVKGILPDLALESQFKNIYG